MKTKMILKGHFKATKLSRNSAIVGFLL